MIKSINERPDCMLFSLFKLILKKTMVGLKRQAFHKLGTTLTSGGFKNEACIDVNGEKAIDHCLFFIGRLFFDYVWKARFCSTGLRR